MDSFAYAITESSYGNIVAIAKDGRLLSLDVTEEPVYTIEKQVRTRYRSARPSDREFRRLFSLLALYFRGKQVDFTIELEWEGVSGFTRRVLEETAKIPYGRISSYGQIGRRLGYPMAARAVGQALGRNPFPLVIPCHRVLRGDGTLGGFGMGLGLKARLLALEGIPPDRYRDVQFR